MGSIIGPGETRAERIDGGVTRQLSTGDVIVIPPGIPHQFIPVKGTFSYVVVKVAN